MTTVVVVESPAKAKTINKYLGKDYEVIASYGHVRDLPSKNGSVDPDNDFAMVWDSDPRSKKQIADIVKLVKGSDKLVLATDPDREGEAISWHILDVLLEKKALKDQPVERVAFNEITKSAILAAIAEPRDIDQSLVDSYLARRAVDYLYGFTLSPVLWRKLPGSRSAGRVQSVALRLVCEREEEIEVFKPREYWSVTAQCETPAPQLALFDAALTHLKGDKLDKFTLGNEDLANEAVLAIDNASFHIGSVEKKQVNRHPSAPFITSTLQQEAARKLGFSASRTMQTAQRLYEAGHITYMRTDSTILSGTAIGAIRARIQSEYGDKYLPDSPRQYKAKGKYSQGAHEAIRPTNFDKAPTDLSLEDDQFKLYTLIWKRTMACQMAAAIMNQVAIDVVSEDKQVTLRATGQTIAFDGFIKVYMEGRDDEGEDGAAAATGDNILPPVKEGDKIKIQAAVPEQHFTKPPPRYTEASLVKKLEELGIGRPSTYASIIQVLQDRTYVKLEQKRFFATDRGLVVTAFLRNFFPRYVEYDFTASMEDELDEIQTGSVNWKDSVRTFWEAFKAAVDETTDLRITEVLDVLNETVGPKYFGRDEDGNVNRKCPACETGILSLKLGKNGAFIGCSNYPECGYTRALEFVEDGAAPTDTIFPKELGTNPEGQKVTLKMGPYGPYVELDLGEDTKPKRGSLPKGMEAGELTLEQALELLKLPRDVGEHPETGQMIIANNGRFGPYIAHDGLFVSLKDENDLFTIGLNHAVDMIKEKEQKVDRRLVGEHPKTGTSIYTQKARFGYIVQWGQKKQAVPKGMKAADLTLDEALELFKKDKKSAGKSTGKKSGGKAKETKADKKKPASKSKTKSAPKSKKTSKKKTQKKA